MGAELDRLPSDEWWVFHALPRGSSGTDIDHLVIGVGGVFCINTKNVSGNVWVAERTIMVSGAKTNYLPVASAEATDVGKRLSRVAGRPIRVLPLVVFTKPITIRARPVDVGVLESAHVRTWFAGQPRILSPQQAFELVLIANQPETWV